jgi:Protein of unknown function (DUF2281)
MTMTQAIYAHFDGNVIVPDEPVQLPVGQRLRVVVDIEPPADPPRRQLGTLKGTVEYMAPDFDAPLDDFKEYME